MALRAIRINNDPILKRPCREVPQVDDRVRQLLDDMLETLHATANGAAIAAPQVGILRRLIVIDMGELSGGPLKLVNPRIIFQEGQQECEEEGCLSFPDCWLTTVRPQRVIVEAMNEEGKTILLTGSGRWPSASATRSTIWTASPSSSAPSTGRREGQNPAAEGDGRLWSGFSCCCRRRACGRRCCAV